MKLSDVGLLKFGNTIQLIGGVWAGEGKAYVCLFPEESKSCLRVDQPYVDHFEVVLSDSPTAAGGDPDEVRVEVLSMDVPDWEAFLRQTDLMETEVLAKAKDGTLVKAIIRKSTRQVDQSVSWKVFERDDFRCRYCHRRGPMTVDHLVRWEEGGPSIEANLLSACRKCNRTRGDMPYADWLNSPYYKNVSSFLPLPVLEANRLVAETLPSIPRKLHVNSR